MPEFRHLRSSSLNIPNGTTQQQQQQQQNPAMAATAAAPRFEGPRSPPNTSHVPCKFFRQGACQAGNACPFSHDIGQATETVCKYFAKGNCKFGPKCANVHVLPDGRRINYGKNGVTIGAVPINLAGRPAHSPTSPTGAATSQSPHGKNGSAGHAHAQSTTSALTNSLYRAEYSSIFAFDDRQTQLNHLGRQPSIDNGLPVVDVPYSHTSSAYGSPRDEDAASRLGLGLSPVNGKGLSVLDAPLPASFDSNGISNAARFPAGPWPSSVPSKFGLDSPSQSLNNPKERTSETLKLLHTSAFGSSEHLATPTTGSPTNFQTTNGGADEYFGKRAMHSSRYARPKMLSSSLPKTGASAVDRDWEDEFAFGVGDESDDNVPENYIPENLQELLTPTEKARRGSMRADGDIIIDGITRGSPNSSSPGRWGPVFPRQKEEEDLSRSARAAASAFGHVGSPLRNSTLAQEMGGASGSPGGLSRPGPMRSGSESMSVLSQQLQRSRLEDTPSSSSPHLHPVTAKYPNSGIGKDPRIERHVSSGSISSSVTGRFTTPIDEEEPPFFAMEDEDDQPSTRARKRASAGLNMGGWGSYAGAVSGKGSSSSGIKDSRDSPAAVNGQ
jgi:hypothetical protein